MRAPRGERWAGRKHEPLLVAQALDHAAAQELVGIAVDLRAMASERGPFDGGVAAHVHDQVGVAPSRP
jgi:hypothetical protein